MKMPGGVVIMTAPSVPPRTITAAVICMTSCSRPPSRTRPAAMPDIASARPPMVAKSGRAVFIQKPSAGRDPEFSGLLAQQPGPEENPRPDIIQLAILLRTPERFLLVMTQDTWEKIAAMRVNPSSSTADWNQPRHSAKLIGFADDVATGVR